MNLGELAGQISAQMDAGKNSTVWIRTQGQNDVVFVDFYPADWLSNESSESISFTSLLTPDGGNKPTTLSLSACCRILEEHGGHIWMPSSQAFAAFRVELRAAANSRNRSPYAPLNRSAVRSTS